ncbi:hypothetical protein KHP62_20940 [Rhodobacteraceae bacterium NNCM2]|nr:hypothetical protein [Coraliihabitans acroporae]
MCRDLPAVEAAIAAGGDIQSSACDDRNGNRCAFFETCLKQANRREVAEADIVVAAYDALYTGFAIETSSIGAILIDEACWQRAESRTEGIILERFAAEPLSGMRCGKLRDEMFAAMADLQALRRRVADALLENGPGAVSRQCALQGGATAEACRLGVQLEKRRLRDTGLRPGAAPELQKAARKIAADNGRIRRNMAFWQALAAFLEGGASVSGRLQIREGKLPTGEHEVVVHHIAHLHRNLKDIPILHLDATLRPDLARTVLPRLEVAEIAAAAPNMTLGLVCGGFGKSALIADPRASEEENRRRASKLGNCTAHVAWQARRVAPGRVLVITYKDCEAAFQGIPGVETAHFNAVAGLDGWGEVALLIVIGRPLPRDTDAAAMAGAFFDRVATGGYRPALNGVTMSDGRVRGVRTLVHADDRAETLRAAICDDELVQAIGRGRCVNRSASNPLSRCSRLRGLIRMLSSSSR